MKIVHNIFRLVIICSTASAFGQGDCGKNNIVGQWRQVESLIGEYTHEDIDSLKVVISTSTGDIGRLTFNKDDTYTYSFLDSQEGKRKAYSVDSQLCQILVGTKRRNKRQSNFEIIYVDKEILIFKEDNNPKGYLTHLLVRM